MADNDNRKAIDVELEKKVAERRAAPAQPDDAELLWRLHQKLERMGWDTDEEGRATLDALDRAWRRA